MVRIKISSTGGNMNLVTVAQMRKIEQQGNAAGVGYDQMIQTVGAAIAAEVDHRYHDVGCCVLGLIGSGNNGRDTLAAMTGLLQRGWRATAILTGNHGNPAPELEDFKQHGGQAFEWADISSNSQQIDILNQADVILDGIYGIGFHLPLNQEVKLINRAIKLNKNPNTIILAVDCPSGMDCNSGQVDEDTLPALGTIIIEAAKFGQLTMPSFSYLGELIPVSLKLPNDLPVYEEINRSVLTAETFHRLLPPRPLESNKGTYGTVSIAGGSDKYPGAPLIAGKAAVRSGCGMVRMVVPECVKQSGIGLLVEAIWEPSAHFMNQLPTLKGKNAVLIGPGLGQSDESSALFWSLLDTLHDLNLPVVIDADGLNLLAREPDWHNRLPRNTILTPHPGEMARLSGISVEEVQENRLALCEAEAAKRSTTIVLKGALTLICHPDGSTAVMPFADSCLAKAGSGDMLAGIIAGFAAQGASAYDAARLGVFLHASAGSYAKKEAGQAYSVTIPDLIDSISTAFRSILSSS